jgi:hypothetical protein
MLRVLVCVLAVPDAFDHQCTVFRIAALAVWRHRRQHDDMTSKVTPIVSRRTQPSASKYVRAASGALLEHGAVVVDPEELRAALEKELGKADMKKAMEEALRIIAAHKPSKA